MLHKRLLKDLFFPPLSCLQLEIFSSIHHLWHLDQFEEPVTNVKVEVGLFLCFFKYKLKKISLKPIMRVMLAPLIPLIFVYVLMVDKMHPMINMK